MKKYLLLFCMLFTVSSAMYAQKGMKEVGGHLAFNVTPDFSAGLGFDFRYNFTNYYRLAVGADFQYDGTAEEMAYNLDLDNHIFLCKNKRVRPYGIVGIGFFAGYEEYSDWSGHYSDFAQLEVRFGFGLNLRISHKLTANAELINGLGTMACQSHSVYMGPKINLGLAYAF